MRTGGEQGDIVPYAYGLPATRSNKGGKGCRVAPVSLWSGESRKAPMTDRATIEALTQKAVADVSAAITTAIQAVVEEAFRAGEASARRRVLAAINGGAPDSAAGLPSSTLPGEVEGSRRAPRGLTKEVVTRLLTNNPQGLPLERVQELALRADSRLAEKTVYNELMRGRMAEYRVIEGTWWLASLAPNVKVAATEWPWPSTPGRTV